MVPQCIFHLLKNCFNALVYKHWRRMKVKEKILVGGIVVGVIGVFLIPESACGDVGETFCGIAPIIGYVGFGLAGLIVCIKLLKILRQLCECCCDSFIGRFRRHRVSEPLLRDSYWHDNYQNDQASGGIEEPFQYQQQEEEQSQVPQIQEPFFYDFEPVRQSFNQKECSICLDEFKEDDMIDRQRCNHKFHEACIRDWLQKNPNCPICRLQLR